MLSGKPPEPTEGRDDYPTDLVDYSETLTTTHYEGGIGQNEERDTLLYPPPFSRRSG